MCVDAAQYRILPVDGVCCTTGIIDESLRVGVQRDSEQVPFLGPAKKKQQFKEAFPRIIGQFFTPQRVGFIVSNASRRRL